MKTKAEIYVEVLNTLSINGIDYDEELIKYITERYEISIKNAIFKLYDDYLIMKGLKPKPYTDEELNDFFELDNL